MKASVIVPAYGRHDLTLNLIKTFQGIGLEHRADLLIVDDAYPEPLEDAIKNSSIDIRTNVRYTRNQTNLGFGGSCNRGAELAENDVLMFLNNDVVIYGDFVTPAIMAVRGNPNCLFGVQLVQGDAGWNKFRERTVSYLAGWCLWCRWQVWDLLGGFDPRYGKYDFEDVDLAMTAHEKGVPLVTIRLPIGHIGGQTIKFSPEREAHTRANREKFASKWQLTV